MSKASFFDPPPIDEVPESAQPKQSKDSASKDDSSSEPANDSKNKPAELKKQKPRSKPSKNKASSPKPSASPKKPMKAKGERKGNPDQHERDSNAGDDASKDDGLHDDFFRKGEEVDKEHIAAQLQAAKDPLEFEDTRQSRLVARRTSPEAVARRNKLRKSVALVLAPVAVIAFIAGYKLVNGTSHAAQPDRPVAKVSVQPHTPAPSTDAMDSPPAHQQTNPDVDPDAALKDASDAEMASLDAGEDMTAAREAEAGAEDATDDPPAADLESAVLQGDVNFRKEAVIALNKGKWEKAEKMASAAISADPDDATLYLYRGTALQEMGQRSKAKAVFERCVEVAKRGPINECRMFSR
ncbi:MAG: hypothetical protein CSA75_02665 [Sorangium cellulosum]|nr:MAG: hypothetical protein CSA75_02665 [Sorangium cellulosum]